MVDPQQVPTPVRAWLDSRSELTAALGPTAELGAVVSATRFGRARRGAGPAVTAGPRPIAWLGRVSTDDQQDPVGSLLRQFRVSEAGLPPGCVIVARFYDGSDASTSGRRGLLPCRPVAGTVVFDLGEVLVPSRGVLSVLARELGIEPEALAAAYWRDRLDFDRGGSPYAYWSGVLAELSREPDPALIASLDKLDAAAWSTLPQGSAELLTHLGRAGIRLTLLSNAPLPLATAVRSAGWSNLFDTLVFSGEIRLVKPDPAIYAAADRTYGTRPGDVIFFDDRQVNVDAAIAHGWAAHVWTGPAAVLDLLGVR